MVKPINTNWQPFTGKYEEDPCYIRYGDKGEEIGPCFANADESHTLLTYFHEAIDAKKVTHVRYMSWDAYFDWMEKDRREYKALQEQKAKEQANA